ncbi:MAG: ACP S-malonyltransferase [Pseudobdellovibrionaceae bacterium]
MSVTLLFPGQGSQHPGMGQFLYDNFAEAKQVFAEASEALSLDLKKLCFEGSEADLALTENTQPALLTVSTATARVIQSLYKPQITAAAGHSIGEYAALVAAGSLTLSAAVKAVRIRGQAMQSAVPVGQGGMTAVLGLDNQQIIDLCKYTEVNSGFSPVSPANFNSPGQIVISGSLAALNWLKDNFAAEKIWPENTPRRVKLISLAVSAPFHCAMMKPAEDKMREVLSAIDFKDASFPIVQNYEAKAVVQGSTLRENLIRQVSAPVLWTQTFATLKDLKSKNCIECGAGKVLSGLAKKIDAEAFTIYNTTNLDEVKALETVLTN